MLQYFFSTCRSDGKERISFMYPPSLIINFFENNTKKNVYVHNKENSLMINCI